MHSSQQDTDQEAVERWDTESPAISPQESTRKHKYPYRVFVPLGGKMRAAYFLHDEWVARHIVDTREPRVPAYVMDARGNVIHRNEESANSPVDLGQ